LKQQPASGDEELVPEDLAALRERPASDDRGVQSARADGSETWLGRRGPRLVAERRHE
jgi:hypothetical protein